MLCQNRNPSVRNRTILALMALLVSAEAQDQLKELQSSFREPPMDCRPHTRWWWMGNALSKEDITWQLEQMRAQGIGGVEQITMEPVYERGNHPYLSEAYFDLVRHAIQEARRRQMEVSLNFGGPGWIWGGETGCPLTTGVRICWPAQLISKVRNHLRGTCPLRQGSIPATLRARARTSMRATAWWRWWLEGLSMARCLKHR